MNRLLVPRIAILLVFAVLVGRLYQLQLGETAASRSRSQIAVSSTRYLPTRPLRGEVFASDGKTLLAESVPIYNVAIRPADLAKAVSLARDDGPRLRAEVFARLSQLLNITSTLTISPAAALEHDPVLRSDLNQGLGAQTMASVRTQTTDLPSRLQIPPEQGEAVAELLRHHGSALHFAPDVASGEAPGLFGAALAEASAALQITGTLTISPATRLQTDQALREDMQRLLGQAALAALAKPPTLTWATIEVPAEKSMVALELSTAYSTTLSLNNPIAEQVERANIPGYQTITIKEDIPPDVALVLRENAASLPGVVVERDYRRRYPLSATTPSLSHILGYTGRISECQLAQRNPARSWSIGLFESIAHVVQCRAFVQKQIDPQSLGRLRYLNDDRIGKDGIELSYEDQLRGQLGTEKVIVDALNRPIRAPEVIQEARNGNNLILTIDVAFQRQVEQILKNWIAIGEQLRLSQSGQFAYKRNYQPIRGGVAIVMEVHSGRILAMVSWPSYDNNIWVDPRRTPELEALLSPPPEKITETLQLAVLTNRAIAGQYPPGSTLKQFDASIALQNGIITPQTRVRDEGILVVRNPYNPAQTFTYQNANKVARGDIDVSEALKVSSNVFFMSVMGGNKNETVIVPAPRYQTIDGGGVGITNFARGLGWFGFGEPTGIPLAGEQSGRVPTPAWKQQAQREAWTTGDTYNMAIGQGNMLVTPLQLVTGAAAIANNGTVYRPQLVKAITDQHGNVIREIPPEVLRRVPVEPQYLAVVRAGMRRSVTEGVNVAARDDCSGLQIAGKTGTAEFGPDIIPGERQTHSWFVGFAPYDNPQIEVVVLSEGTGGLGDGSARIAVPAVTQIMQAYFNVTPPNPLPRGCQAGLPPLPPRVDPAQAPPELAPGRFGR